MDDQRFVVWDARGRPLGGFSDFDTAHRWAHERVRRFPVDPPLSLDDRVARVSRRVTAAGCALVAWVEFAVLPGCDLVAPSEGAAVVRRSRQTRFTDA